MKLYCHTFGSGWASDLAREWLLSWESVLFELKTKNADIPMDASLLSVSTQLCLTPTSLPKLNKYLRLDGALFTTAAWATVSSLTVLLQCNFMCCHNFSLYVCEGLRPLKAITVSPHHVAPSSTQTRHDRAINTPSHPIEHSIQKEEGNTMAVEECSHKKIGLTTTREWGELNLHPTTSCDAQIWVFVNGVTNCEFLPFFKKLSQYVFV